MELRSDITQSKLLSISSGIILAISFGAFAYAHLMAFQRTHAWPLLLFCCSELITAVFLLFRSTPKTVSAVQFDWVAGIAGTFVPLLLRPASWGAVPSAKYALVAGVMIQIAGLISLNRSIAIVAANRKIKTAGLYRFVRHPVYAAYIITFTGYVLMNTSFENLIIYSLSIGLIFVRLFSEERHLAMDSMYREYMLKVNYRVIPFVF